MALVLYENYDDPDTFNFIGSSGVDEYNRAMTFTPSIAHFLKRIELRLYRKGTGGNVTIELRPTTAGLPDGTNAAYGSALTSITVDCSAITTDSGGEWVIFDFDPAANLVAGTVYAICVACDVYDSSTNWIRWTVKATGAYAGGSRCRWDIAGSGVWEADNPDFSFREYGTLESEGILVVTGTGSIFLSYETSTATGTFYAAGVCLALLSYESPLIVQGNCIALLSYEFYETIEWPEDRPEDPSIEDGEWDEETQTWITTTKGPGRHKNSIIAIGQGDANEGVIYFGDV